MALQDLATLDEFKGKLRITDDGEDVELALTLTRASSAAAKWCRRRFMIDTATTTYSEFHSIRARISMLWTREIPIIAVTKVTEDTNREHDTATALVKDTDYLVEKNSGEFRRISGSFPIRWEFGERSVRIQYQGGYAESADKLNVPDDLKEAALRVGANIYRQDDAKIQAVKSKSDSTGNKTFFDARFITPDVAVLLRPYRRVGRKTWEEAA